MLEAISNTSPLLYLYRASVLEWLPKLFTGVWTPRAVVMELQEGRRRGYVYSDLTVGPLPNRLWCWPHQVGGYRPHFSPISPLDDLRIPQQAPFHRGKVVVDGHAGATSLCMN